MNRQNFVAYFCCFAILSLCSCSKGTYRKNQKKLATLYQQKNYKQVEDFVKKKSFLNKKDDVLLKNLEVGKAYYNTGKYCNAIEKLNEAGRIIEEQHTKSIGSAISSSLGIGDGIFYGETYEKSLLNFYKSLSNYAIYIRGYCEPMDDANNGYKKDGKSNKYFSEKERKNFFNASRSNILYWDSWINGRYVEEDDKFYIDDILLKLWGAFIHEQAGDNSNLQIARQLYKDAKYIAKNRYAVYKTFNSNNQNFVKYLQDIEKRSNFLENDNIYVRDIIEYCDRQLERLKNNKQRANFAIVLSDNSISTKSVTEHKIPILSILSTASANLITMVTSFGIDNAKYELPYIEYKDTNYRYFYELVQNNEVIFRKPLVLAEPISDISYMSLEEKLSGIKKNVIAFVTAKYIAGLTPVVASYMIARKSKSSVVRFIGYLTALLSYKSIEYLITEGSRVDIRQWVDLPSNIFMVSDSIKEGKYKLNIVKQNNANNTVVVNGQSNETDNNVIVHQMDVEINDKMKFIDIHI